MWMAWLRLVQVPFALFALLAIGGIVISRRLTLQYEGWGSVLNARQRRLELLNLISSNVNAGTPVLKLVDEALQQLANQLPDLRVSYAVIDASGQMVPVCACAGVDCEYAGGTRWIEPRARAHARAAIRQAVAIGNTALRSRARHRSSELLTPRSTPGCCCR
jgi:hypothetical protein